MFIYQLLRITQGTTFTPHATNNFYHAFPTYTYNAFYPHNYTIPSEHFDKLKRRPITGRGRGMPPLLAALGVDPNFAEIITVFHIADHKLGPVPADRSAGDATGAWAWPCM